MISLLSKYLLFSNNSSTIHVFFNFRDVLTADAVNVFKYDGSGYVTLSTGKWKYDKMSAIRLKFKTYAADGLLYLMGDNKVDFLSIELQVT